MTTASLATTVGGIPLESCVYNASGPRTGSSAALAKICASASGAVLAKSATILKQDGNPQPRTWHDTSTNGASLNSEGLPNAGIDYYISPTTIEESTGESPAKPYMVSISGKTLNDNLEMLKRILVAASDKAPRKSNIAAIELNLACPNVIGKPIIAYDFDQLKAVLKAVSKVKGIKDMPLGVKLPPYFDGPHFASVAKILNDYKHILKFVATINTIGNALSVDPVSEAPSIASKGGLAGLSGRAVKFTALANVRQMRLLLDKSIDLVGVGGIESGTDAFEMLLCGASAVQVGTCHWKEGPKCFDRICGELRELMESKGYASIQDFRCKLKEWSKEGAAKSREARRSKKQAKTEKDSASSEGTAGRDKDFGMLMIMNALMMVAVAVLLADKLGVVSI